MAEMMACDRARREQLDAGLPPKRRLKVYVAADAGLFAVVNECETRVINQDFVPYIRAVSYHVRVGARD